MDDPTDPMTLDEAIYQLNDLNDNNTLPGDRHNEAVEYAITVLENIQRGMYGGSDISA